MRKKRSPLTAWELPDLIRRQPLRSGGSSTVKLQPWHARIVGFTHLLRFATASMLQRQFPHALTSERTAQRHLAALVQRGYLATAQPWAVGPNFPYVYHATPSGLRFVKSELGERFLLDSSPAEEKRTRGHGLHSLLHELFLSELTLELTRTVGERDDLRLLELQRRYFRREHRLTYRDNGERKKIEPDLGFLAATRGSGAWELLPMHFVEMENGTHPVREIGEKLAAYDRWARQEGSEYLTELYKRHGVQKNNPDFRLLIVCHDKYGSVGDEHVLVDWLIQTLEFSRGMRCRVWLCTVGDLKGASPGTIAAGRAVWYRVNDAGRWLAAYRKHVGNRTSQQGNRRYVRHREFVSEMLPNMPRHALFPNQVSAAIQPVRNPAVL